MPLVSLLRGKQFYYDDAGVPSTPKAIIPTGRPCTSANGDSAPWPALPTADHYSERAVPHLRER